MLEFSNLINYKLSDEALMHVFIETLSVFTAFSYVFFIFYGNNCTDFPISFIRHMPSMQ